MNSKTIAKLAVAGLLTGSMSMSAGCKNSPDTTEEATAEAAEEETAAAEEGSEAAEEAPTETAETAAEGAAAAEGEKQYAEIHDCAGKNACKGLGGCKVTAEKLEKLANAAGVDPAEAGEPHDCAGKNACKGLGGCSVDAEKLAMLKKKLNEKGDDAPSK